MKQSNRKDKPAHRGSIRPAGKLSYADAVNHAASLLRDGKLQEADRLCRDLLKARPDDFNALLLLGILRSQQGNRNEGLLYFDQALRQNPKSYDALYNRAATLLALKRHSEAIDSYDKALSVKPDCVESLNDRGNALQALKRHSEAIDSYDRALTLKPDYADALNNRGNALQALTRYGEAIDSYDKALILKPDHVEVLNHRGATLQALRRYGEALDSYDRALSLKPQHADALLNKSLLLLLLGEFDRGWPLYEWRRKARNAPAERPFAKPLWLGQEDIAGKRLLLHSEQGFGDTIQFCRYAKTARSAGATVVLEVPQPLRVLLRNLEAASEVVESGDQSIQYDLHCPLLSLPLACKTVLSTIPCETPYLKAEEGWLAKWSAKLGVTDALRVGLVWSGSTAHVNDYNRSIRLSALSSLFSLRVDWICLQNEIRNADDDPELERSPSMRHFEKDIQDFSDTAALVELCDLVISVDTAVAHLAGALGKPLWLLLPFSPDWRWMMEREDSPWYPTARLFRQPAPGDWDSVVHRVRQELQSRLDQDCLRTSTGQAVVFKGTG